MSSHMQWKRWKTKFEKFSKKYDIGGSGCAEDAVKTDGSGGSAYVNREKTQSAQEDKGRTGG